MPSLLFDPSPVFSIPVKGLDAEFPVSRIFCVGRNYAAHAAEGGAEPPKYPILFHKTHTSLNKTNQ